MCVCVCLSFTYECLKCFGAVGLAALAGARVLHCQSAVCFCISIKADVLVNRITCPTSDMAKAGVVSSSLLTAAESQLQTASTECL